MRWAAIGAMVFGVACASHRESPPPRRSVTSNETRCTLRISQGGTFVDGEPMSRSDAVSYCKRTDGAMVVIEDDVPCDDWEPTCSALRREGVRIAMRGPVGDFRQANPDKLVLRCQATCK